MVSIRLFISHSERDREIVLPLKDWLESGLGLKSDEVRCTSATNIDAGGFAVEARFDLGLRPECVVVTNGWWASDGAPVNVCSLGRETDLGHGAAFHDNRVEVERA